jgi:hydrogenase maturation protease
MATRDILIGLGNPIMSDDGIGPLVSEKVHERIPDCDLDMSCAGGFDVVDRILGHRRAVIIDCMVSGKHQPGTVVRIDADSPTETLRAGHSHGINFLEAIDLARSCDAPVPAEVIVYGIEVENPFSLGRDISESLREKLDRIVEEITHDLTDTR